eukprot:3520108-Amphidinium_carterae.1
MSCPLSRIGIAVFVRVTQYPTQVSRSEMNKAALLYPADGINDHHKVLEPIRCPQQSSNLYDW